MHTLRLLIKRRLTAEQMLLVGIIALALAYRLGLGSWPVDDAYITFRYARNLAQGDGFVYNPGERILGTTTPLYTLLLGTANLLTADIQFTSFAVNLLADALTMVLLYMIGKQLSMPWLGLLTGLLVAISSEYAYYTVSGMETPLYICIMLATFWASLVRRWRLMATLAAVLVLLRIDGLIFVAAMASTLIVRRQPVGWRPVVLFAAMLLPWVIFSAWYFGSPLPQSMVAKSAYGLTGNRWASVINFTAYFTNTADQNTGSDKSLLFAGLAVLGMVVVAREQRFAPLRPYLFWAWLYSFALMTANVFTYFMWYFIPLYPVYFVCILIGFTKLFEIAPVVRAWRRLLQDRPSINARSIQLGLAFVLCLAAALSLPAKVAAHRHALADWTDEREGAYRAIAEMIAESSSASTTIGAVDIGALGYYSQRVIIDGSALVTPGAVGKSLLEIVKQWQPEWWIITVEKTPPLLADPWFHQAYEPLVNRPDHSPGIAVFRRLSPPQASSQ